MPKVQYYYKPVARMKKRQPHREKSKEELANQTATKKSSTFDTATNHSNSLSRDIFSRTHRSLQDLLAHRSQILVARNE